MIVWGGDDAGFRTNTGGRYRAPEVLKRIKDIYGGDRRGYLETYVRVVYAELILFNEVFLKDARSTLRNGRRPRSSSPLRGSTHPRSGRSRRRWGSSPCR